MDDAPKSSDGPIATFVKQKWIELATFAVVALMGLYGISLNREVGTVGVRLDGVEDHFKDVDNRFDGIDSRLDALSQLPERIAVLNEKVATIQRDVDTLRNLQQGRLMSRYKRANFKVVDAGAAPREYVWKFKRPLDPETISNMAVEPIDLPTGIDVTATIADDGTGCIMTLDGADEALRQLPDEIPADVSITTRG